MHCFLLQKNNMKKVVIIAPTGMLGSMVYHVLQNNCSLILVYRDEKKLQLLNDVYGGVAKHKTILFDLLKLQEDYKMGFHKETSENLSKKFFREVGEIDAVINCGGIINTKIYANWQETLFLNSFIPHILSNFYKEKFIHITTDCVFDGKENAPYDENMIASPVDWYGLSKSIGEPSRNSLVLRTSIIGPEIADGTSLLEWVKKQKNKTVYGYTNHLWNGITTKAFGHICQKIVLQRDRYPKNGLYHVFSTDISKYEMIKKIARKYGVQVKVIPKAVDTIDRRLRTVYTLNKKLHIPPFDKMLQDL